LRVTVTVDPPRALRVAGPAPAHPPRSDTLRAAESATLRVALLDLVAAARRTADRDRAALLLFDERGALVPVVSVGRSDDAVWTHVRPAPLADLGAVTRALSVLGVVDAVGVDEAERCPWLPAALRTAYGVDSFVVAPLVAQSGTLGVLVVYSNARHPHTQAELAALSSVATAAAAAVAVTLRAAADADAALARDVLLAATPALHRSGDVADVLRAALGAGAEVVRGTGLCAGLVGSNGDVTLVDGSGRPRRFADLGAAAADVEAAVRAPLGRPVVVRPEALRPWVGRSATPLAAVVVVPLGDVAGGRAFAAFGCPLGAGPDAATIAVLGRLREHAVAACARAREAADAVRRVQHLEVLYQLADDVALAPDIQLVVERLAPAVRAAAGAELIDVFLCDAAASRLFGTHVARGSLARLLGRWRRAPRARIREDGGLLVVPMLLDDTLVGVVRVRPLGPLEPAEEQLLQTIADGLGEMVSRTCLRDRVAASERELAVADERERIARDLHDTLGQMHFAVRTELGELAHAAAGSPLEARLAALEQVVSRADTELRQAIHALSFLGRGSHGLVPSVRALVRRVRDEQKLDVRLKLAGTPAPLPPDQEEALYRLVREALTNVVRHARATYANVTVSFEAECVRVDIRDDGTGLVQRPGGTHGLHFGLRSMQRRLADVGGEVHVRNRSPHGVTVSGWVPR
jgi:signal transduction histidine kinase